MTHEIWKNAPEDATHYSPETDATHAVFYKDDFKQMWIEKWSNLGWQEAHSLNEHERPIPRPTSTAIPEPKKLTQAVFEGLPPEYRWAAVDGNGELFVYANKDPVKGFNRWQTAEQCRFIGSGYDATDWQNSLIERVLICDAETLEPLADQAAAEIERLQAEVERLDQCIGELRLELSKCQERNDELCIASHNQTVKISKIRKVINEN